MPRSRDAKGYTARGFFFARLKNVSETAIENSFLAHRKLLWGLCYRMTGCPADADDVLQDAMERAVRKPPADTQRDLKPWLVRVTMNVARDHLRRRKRARYAGPWLPGPTATDEEADGMLTDEPSPEARYGELESLSFAFLRAAEVLSPTQRAVLLLRDVLDHSVAETASLLEITEANTKTTLHRARARMVDYEAGRLTVDQEQQEHARRALQAFLLHVATNNQEALRLLLSPDVVTLNDGAGEFISAQRPVIGLERTLKFHRRARRVASGMRLCSLNGAPALLVQLTPYKPRYPMRSAIWIELDAQQRIREVNWIAATRKLQGLDWDLGAPGPREVVEALQSTLQHPPARQWLPRWAVGAVRRGWQDVQERVRTPRRGTRR